MNDNRLTAAFQELILVNQHVQNMVRHFMLYGMMCSKSNDEPSLGEARKFHMLASNQLSKMSAAKDQDLVVQLKLIRKAEDSLNDAQLLSVVATGYSIGCKYIFASQSLPITLSQLLVPEVGTGEVKVLDTARKVVGRSGYDFADRLAKKVEVNVTMKVNLEDVLYEFHHAFIKTHYRKNSFNTLSAAG